MKPDAPASAPRSSSPPTLVVGAVSHETSQLEERLSAQPITEAPWPLREAPGVLFLHCGIGPANAGAALAWVLATRPVTRVINVGSAGSFDLDQLPLLAVAQVTEDHFGDMGAELPGTGWSTSEELRLFLGTGPNNHFALPPLPLPPASPELTIRNARAITVHHVTGSPQERQARYERTGALVESMEGAALALVCRRFQVAFHQLRGVSNLAGAPRGNWKFREAGIQAQRAVLALGLLDERESA